MHPHLPPSLSSLPEQERAQAGCGGYKDTEGDRGITVAGRYGCIKDRQMDKLARLLVLHTTSQYIVVFYIQNYLLLEGFPMAAW